MHIIVVFILISFGSALFGSIEGIYDAVNGTDKDHSKDFKARVKAGAIISLAFNIIFVLKWRMLLDGNNYIVALVGTVLMLLAIGFAYGVFLDQSFNVQKGKSADYIGNTAKSDYRWRKIFGGRSWGVIISKSAAWLAFTALFIFWLETNNRLY